jgi:hypothetical protein
MLAYSSSTVSSAYGQLADLASYYPDFESWYWTKVVPGLGNQSRALFVHEQRGQFSVVIAKRTPNEKKLCTVRTNARSLGQRVATNLIFEAMDWLGCEKPLITVPEERLSEFKAIFSRLDFSLGQIADSYYRPDRREYIFNGRIVNGREWCPPQLRSCPDHPRSLDGKRPPVALHAL